MKPAEIAEKLRAAYSSAQRRDLALDLLDATTSRQYIDLALDELSADDVRITLTDAHRPHLRKKALYYFDQPPEKDKGGMIREAIIRLLAGIGHPDDIDLYQMGVLYYHLQPVRDVAQNLRAACLIGLATCDDQRACIYAAHLLGEPHTSELNGEPSRTALDILLRFNQVLSVYQFAQHGGASLVGTPSEDVVGAALDKLVEHLPHDVYLPLAERYLEMGAAVACAGIVDGIVRKPELDALHLLLERILSDKTNGDLHRYAALQIAASRNDTLTEILFRYARLSPRELIHNYIEAVELTTHPERDVTLATLQKRV